MRTLKRMLGEWMRRLLDYARRNKPEVAIVAAGGKLGGFVGGLVGSHFGVASAIPFAIAGSVLGGLSAVLVVVLVKRTDEHGVERFGALVQLFA
jgi:hypothetical protein